MYRPDWTIASAQRRIYEPAILTMGRGTADRSDRLWGLWSNLARVLRERRSLSRLAVNKAGECRSFPPAASMSTQGITFLLTSQRPGLGNLSSIWFQLRAALVVRGSRHVRLTLEIQ